MVKKIPLPQQTWANGAAGGALTKTFTIALHGRCEQITVKINNNTGNRTLTLTIANLNSGTLFTQAAIPENATTVYAAISHKAVQDANFNPFLADEICTITMVLSGDPGESTGIADVDIYMAEAEQ